MLKALFKPLMIVVAFAAGVLFPELGMLNWLIRYMLMVLLFFVFLQLKSGDFKICREHCYIAVVNLLLPIGLWALLRWSGQDALAEAAFFTAVSPTATAASVIMKFLGGNAGFVFTSFIFTNFLITGALLFLLPVMITGQTDLGGFLSVAVNLLSLIFIPLILAKLSDRFFIKGRALPGKTGDFTFILWVLMIAIIGASAVDFIKKHPDIPSGILWAIGGVSMLICAANFTIGTFLGGRKLSREASQSLGQKNTSLTIVLAMTFSSPLAALGPTFYVFWHNLWNAWQLYLFERQKQ